MQTTKVTFEGRHDGQRARVRFESLDNARNQITVQVGRRERKLTMARTVKPCTTNASLLVDMLAGEDTKPRRRVERRSGRESRA